MKLLSFSNKNFNKFSKNTIFAPKNPQLFFFTDRKRFTDIFAIIKKLPKNTAIIIREYDLSYQNRIIFAKKIVKIARKNNLITFAAKSFKLYFEAKTDGIHFSDNDKSWQKYCNYKRNNPRILLSCACHNKKNLIKAAKKDFEFLFISPIFRTDSHPEAKEIGHLKLSRMILDIKYHSNIYALGGVNSRNLKLIKNSGIGGFGFISFGGNNL